MRMLIFFFASILCFEVNAMDLEEGKPTAAATKAVNSTAEVKADLSSTMAENSNPTSLHQKYRQRLEKFYHPYDRFLLDNRKMKVPLEDRTSPDSPLDLIPLEGDAGEKQVLAIIKTLNLTAPETTMFAHDDATVHRVPSADILTVSCGNMPERPGHVVWYLDDSVSGKHREWHREAHRGQDTTDIDFALDPTVLYYFGSKKDVSSIFKGHQYKEIHLEGAQDLFYALANVEMENRRPLPYILENLLQLLKDGGTVYASQLDCGVHSKEKYATKEELKDLVAKRVDISGDNKAEGEIDDPVNDDETAAK